METDCELTVDYKVRTLSSVKPTRVVIEDVTSLV